MLVAHGRGTGTRPHGVAPTVPAPRRRAAQRHPRRQATALTPGIPWARCSLPRPSPREPALEPESLGPGPGAAGGDRGAASDDSRGAVRGDGRGPASDSGYSGTGP
jgi:hypothetical protein